MVMMCEPIWDAVNAIEAESSTPARRVLLSPQGTPLNQALVEDLAKEEHLLLKLQPGTLQLIGLLLSSCTKALLHH